MYLFLSFVSSKKFLKIDELNKLYEICAHTTKNTNTNNVPSLTSLLLPLDSI